MNYKKIKLDENKVAIVIGESENIADYQYFYVLISRKGVEFFPRIDLYAQEVNSSVLKNIKLYTSKRVRSEIERVHKKSQYLILGIPERVSEYREQLISVYKKIMNWYEKNEEKLGNVERLSPHTKKSKELSKNKEIDTDYNQKTNKLNASPCKFYLLKEAYMSETKFILRYRKNGKRSVTKHILGCQKNGKRSETKFILGYTKNGKTYLVQEKGKLVELFSGKQLEKLSQLAGLFGKNDIDELVKSLKGVTEAFAIEVNEPMWSANSRSSIVSDSQILKLWHSKLTHLGAFRIAEDNDLRIHYFSRGLDGCALIGYVNRQTGKIFYHKTRIETTEYLYEANPFSYQMLADFLEHVEMYRDRKYFLIHFIKSLKKSRVVSILQSEDFREFTQVVEAKKQSVKGVPLPQGMFRYARHSKLGQVLQTVAKSDYQQYKDFKPFLSNVDGDVLRIPCEIKGDGTRLYIYGWYVKDDIVKLRWFPSHNDAISKRSSGIYIDITTKELFFSGQVYNGASRDPVFLEDLIFEEKEVGRRFPQFETSFTEFWNYIQKMRQENLIIEKEI